MRLLICTPYLPWPLDSGGRASQFSILDALPNEYEIKIIYRQQSLDDNDNAREIERRLPNIKVVLVDPIVPSRPPASTRLGVVAWIYYFIRKVAFKLYFSCAKIKSSLSKSQSSLPQDKAPQIQPLPWFPDLRIERSVIEAIQNHHAWADIIQFEFHDYLSAGCLPLGDKPTVFISHQVHTLYIQSWFSSRSSYFESWIAKYYEDLTKETESQLLSKFSKVVVFCDEDAQLLEDIGVSSSIEVSHFPFPSDHVIINPADLDTSDWQQELVFLGSGDHGPNLDGMIWFFESIYPLIAASLKFESNLPRVHVIGSWNDVQMEQLKRFSPVFHGYVDDVGSVLKGRIFISPILIGSGIRTKLLSAALSASPIVSTSLGCQGLGFINNQHCLIGDVPDEFASSVLQVLNSPISYRRALAKNAANHVAYVFSRQSVSIKRSMIYSSLLPKEPLKNPRKSIQIQD